jgi:hypothetical protein
MGRRNLIPCHQHQQQQGARSHNLLQLPPPLLAMALMLPL